MKNRKHSKHASSAGFALPKAGISAVIVFFLSGAVLTEEPTTKPATGPATLPADALTPARPKAQQRRGKMFTAGGRDAGEIVKPVTATSPARIPEDIPAAVEAPTEGRITISRETTCITSPVNPDGTVNYVEYLNRKHSRGVTKDNNAFVGLLKAVGPELVDQDVRDETYKRLDMSPLPADGEYFISLAEYINTNNEDSEESQLQFEKAQSGPWRPDDNPIIAAWLKSNEKPLAGITNAVRHKRYYRPFISHRNPPQLIDVSSPGIGTLRHVAGAMTAMVMMRAGTGDFLGVRSDLITAHCLARLVGREPFLVSRLVSLAIDNIATEAETKLIQKRFLPPDQCGTLLVELHGLSEFPDIRRAYRTDRLMALDCVMMLSRAEGESDAEPARADDDDLPDWNLVLRIINKWFDRCISAACAKTHTRRSELNGKLSKEMNAIEKKYDLRGMPLITAWESVKSQMAPSHDDKKSMSKKLADVMAAILVPNLDDTTTYWFEHKMKHELLKVALALEAYRGRHLKYPIQLTHLMGAQLPQAPTDLFTDRPPYYQRTTGGYLLYSAGANMKDDDGSDDKEKGHDDIVIRVE